MSAPPVKSSITATRVRVRMAPEGARSTTLSRTRPRTTRSEIATSSASVRYGTVAADADDGGPEQGRDSEKNPAHAGNPSKVAAVSRRV